MCFEFPGLRFESPQDGIFTGTSNSKLTLRRVSAFRYPLPIATGKMWALVPGSCFLCVSFTDSFLPLFNPPCYHSSSYALTHTTIHTITHTTHHTSTPVYCPLSFFVCDCVSSFHHSIKHNTTQSCNHHTHGTTNG